MLTWKPTEDAIARFNRKAALGQASVTVADAELRTYYLNYWRFDSDTGLRVKDEVSLVLRDEIATELAAVTAQRDALTARVDLLTAVVTYLDGVAAG